MTGYLLLVALLGANGSIRTDSYADAYKAFQDNDRPMVILVGADWCPACRTMKSASMPEALRRGALKDVSFAVVDVDRSRALASQLMRGSSIPQLIMFYKSNDGVKRAQLTGSQSAGQVQQFVAQAFASQPEEAPVAKEKPSAMDTVSTH